MDSWDSQDSWWIPGIPGGFLGFLVDSWDSQDSWWIPQESTRNWWGSVKSSHQGEVSEEEVKTYEPPQHAKRVYQSKAKDLLEDDEDLPSITLIRTRNYTNINKITERDHLMDNNRHEWKERMRRVFYNCDINEYITEEIKPPMKPSTPLVHLTGTRTTPGHSRLLSTMSLPLK